METSKTWLVIIAACLCCLLVFLIYQTDSPQIETKKEKILKKKGQVKKTISFSEAGLVYKKCSPNNILFIYKNKELLYECSGSSCFFNGLDLGEYLLIERDAHVNVVHKSWPKFTHFLASETPYVTKLNINTPTQYEVVPDCDRSCGLRLAIQASEGCEQVGDIKIWSRDEELATLLEAEWVAGTDVVLDKIPCEGVSIRAASAGCATREDWISVSALAEKTNFFLEEAVEVDLIIVDAVTDAPIEGAWIDHRLYQRMGPSDKEGRLIANIGEAKSGRFYVGADGYSSLELTELKWPSQGEMVHVQLWSELTVEVQCLKNNAPCSAETLVQLLQVEPYQSLSLFPCRNISSGEWSCVVSSDPSASYQIFASQGKHQAGEIQLKKSGITYLELESAESQVCLTAPTAEPPCYAIAENKEKIVTAALMKTGVRLSGSVGIETIQRVLIRCESGARVFEGDLEGCPALALEPMGYICSSGSERCLVQAEDSLLAFLISFESSWPAGSACSTELPAGNYSVVCGEYHQSNQDSIERLSVKLAPGETLELR